MKVLDLKMATSLMVIWEDDTIIAVNKPSGVLSAPGGFDLETPSLAELLEPTFGSLWVVHRLDKEASGILLLARTADAHRKLSLQFQIRTVKKAYHALVVGNPPWDENVAREPLLPNGDRKHRTIVAERDGKESMTTLLVIERFRQFTLVEARPYTGRPHQIRAHLAFLHHPIVADKLYGNKSGLFLSQIKHGTRQGSKNELPLLDRLALHACSLEFTHPSNDGVLHFDAPYPKDFDITLRLMRKYST